MSYVLLVEDDVLNRIVVEDMFCFDVPSHELVCVTTGEEALGQAARRRPDLVLMDLQLPGIDGLETMRRLKLNPKTEDVPIWALTAQAMKNDKDAAMAAGCCEYITKPIESRGFLALIQHFFQENFAPNGGSCQKF